MARIRCKACGRGYSYQGDCCPNCGAFNRRPKLGFIGVDGDYHAVGEKECYEQKVCYEEQAEKVWRTSPDRKPERKSAVKRPNTARFTSREADQVIDRFTRSANEQAKKFANQFLGDKDNAAAAETVERFAQNFREKTAQFSSKRRGDGYAPRRHSSSGKGAVIGLGVGILFVIIGTVFSAASNVNLISDFGGHFEPEREQARPDISVEAAVPLDMYYHDYGGVFRLEDGSEFTAFTTDAYVSPDGQVVVSAFCDGEWVRFDPVVVDERTGTLYATTRSVEWQENNYQLFYQIDDYDPDDYHYGFYYTDTDYDEMYLVAELSSDGSSIQKTGTYYDIPLLDGDTLHASTLTEYEDGILTVTVFHDHPQPGRFQPYLQGEREEPYIPEVVADNERGEYRYTFDIGVADFPREFTFCYLDAAYDAMLNVSSYEVAVGGDMTPVLWGEEYKCYLRDGGVLHANVLAHYDQQKHEIVVYAAHDGDPERFHPHLSRDNADNVSLYGPPIDIEDRGEDGFCYRFDTDSIDPDNSYTFCYLDGNTGDIFYTESIYLPEPPGSEVRRGTMDLSNGTVVEVTVHYTYTDQVLTVFAAHDGDMARLRAFAYDTDTGIYHEVAVIEDDGVGNYTYTFELSGCDPSSTISFGFEDVERSRNYFLMDCFAW